MPVTTNKHLNHCMISDYRCFFCFARAIEKLIERENLTPAQKNTITSQMVELYHQSWHDFSAPAFSRELHKALRQHTQNPDPYKDAKQRSNDLVLSLYPELKQQVLKSDSPFDTALRLAIGGNIIDLAVFDEFDLPGTMHQVLNTDFALNDSANLREELSNAQSVLYLGDNAGEIVFDKLFVETIMHPNLTYAVRGNNIVNDATMHDAHYVGMDSVADLISNGYDAPSTIFEHCSPQFQELFMKADVIIAKGQGNLEGLYGHSPKPFYSLLMVKCQVVADALKVRKGGFVVKKL